MNNTIRGFIALIVLGGMLVLQGCQLIGSGPHRGAPKPAPSLTQVMGEAKTQQLRANLVTVLKADAAWTSSPVTHYGTADTTNQGWFAAVPGTRTECGWETRGHIGAFCTIDGGASIDASDVADWGTYDGHQHCAALVGGMSFVFCRDGYRTTS